MSQPSAKLLTPLLVFVFATVFGALAKGLGIGGVIAASLLGSVAGWVAARWLMRQMF